MHGSCIVEGIYSMKHTAGDTVELPELRAPAAAKREKKRGREHLLTIAHWPESRLSGIRRGRGSCIVPRYLPEPAELLSCRARLTLNPAGSIKKG